ncbi:MAG: SDR family NAD(P)-dependent oxidoreductase [Phormidesmis sp.]
MRLENKVALVTSCRSSLCVEIAQRLAAAGAKVMICGRSAPQGRETVRQIQRCGGRASFVLADVGVLVDVQAAIDETIATYGRLDILLNHISGDYAQDSELADVSESTWERIVESALKGTFFCCQYALPFLQQSSGTIINVVRQSSALRFSAVTTICQGGVAAMTSAIAQQYTVQSVTANMIWVKPFNSPKFNVEPLAGKVAHVPEPIRPAAVSTEATSPALPVISSDFADAATAVLYLASRSSTIQGSMLVVSESR